jgi:small-conductance mechanosensitive channel
VIYALGFAAGVFILLFAIRAFFKQRKKSFDVSSEKFRGVVIPLVFFAFFNTLSIIVFGLYLGSIFLEISENAQNIINIVVVFTAALQIGIWATELLKLYIRERATKQFKEDDAAQATSIKTLGIIGQIIIWVIVILVAADNISGINITALITSLGVGGIAVGFALQNILQDIFASLTISLDKPFALGDFLDLGEHRGTVEKIGLKSTVLKAPTNERIIIGNANLLNSRIKNYGYFEERYGEINFGIHPNTPIPVLRKIPEMISEIVKEVGRTELVRVHLKDMGDYTLNFDLLYKCVNLTFNEFRDTRQEILYRIIEKFTEEGIVMPFPIQKILVEKNGEE